jgi:CRP/FNR family transcriptional regulator, cyclic AMP receptor protein
MGKRIVLIEDNKAVRENISEILELSKYEVLGAPNGKVGVELVIKELPDLVICDIMMPELDGYGVLNAISKEPKTSSIPFIFLTAKSERADFRKGMEMGADDYITKPFDDVELLSAIETRLKKKDQLKKEFALNNEGVNEFMKVARKTGNTSLVSENRETLHLKKRQLVYSAGQTPGNLYFVSKGKVKTFKINELGKELITDIYKEGEFLGYIPLMEDTPYQDTAEALQEAELMVIPKSDFLAILGSDSSVAQTFIKMLSRDVTEKEEKLVSLAYNSLRKRIATGLLQVYDKFKKSPADKPRLEISREDLAQIVGTATESLIRTLSDFKSEKLIDIRDGKVFITDEERLKNMLN